MTITGWPFDHQHDFREVERWSTSTGEIEIRLRCRLCSKTRTTITDRDEATT